MKLFQWQLKLKIFIYFDNILLDDKSYEKKYDLWSFVQNFDWYETIAYYVP